MIQKLNSLLSSEYENIMLQGLQLLEILDDDQLIDYFQKGIEVTEDGRIHISEDSTLKALMHEEHLETGVLHLCVHLSKESC